MASEEPESFHWHYPDLDGKNFKFHGRTLLITVILFTTLLFITFLCIYARWVCRYRQLAVASTHVDLNPAMGAPLAAAGLDPAAIESLPVYVHRSSADEADCSICLSKFEEEEKIKGVFGGVCSVNLREKGEGKGGFWRFEKKKEKQDGEE
ncbi:RING-H2 finger protein ATL66-like [Tasmannia lanceolata]|uniref:RING-H2 finger protein ATL66-like n=1 Tax=Tasmannia lanceolata TaxID=3420 RepID=UPI004062A46C